MLDRGVFEPFEFVFGRNWRESICFICTLLAGYPEERRSVEIFSNLYPAFLSHIILTFSYRAFA